jgi:hypothetical protein
MVITSVYVVKEFRPGYLPVGSRDNRFTSRLHGFRRKSSDSGLDGSDRGKNANSWRNIPITLIEGCRVAARGLASLHYGRTSQLLGPDSLHGVE